MVNYFIISVLYDRGNLFFHKKCTEGMAMSPGVYITAGTDDRMAQFLALFNVIIIRRS